uniref:Uncharacterized protein n=1 Tax=Corethron hystrix TaxID=216773 RepID=A0A7S1BXP2_9STRA|mmetsp:Transcript_4398/g.8541  ORF Transcript_4398/g.8541 Transcript_4398/m.8541 type:complete len:112 (+) Transcript_4398:35-370(+)
MNKQKKVDKSSNLLEDGTAILLKDCTILLHLSVKAFRNLCQQNYWFKEVVMSTFFCCCSKCVSKCTFCASDDTVGLPMKDLEAHLKTEDWTIKKMMRTSNIFKERIQAIFF